MIRAVVGILASIVLAIATSPAAVVEPYSLKPVELKSGDLPAAIAAALNPHGVHVFTYTNGLETPICEVYWAKAIVVQADVSKNKLPLYGSITPGAFLGVIRFLVESSEDYREDFHDQKLEAGYYTMRYAIIKDPATTEPRDFALMSPVKADPDPDKTLTFEELSQLSRKASGTSEPAILSMVAVDENDKTFPDVNMADDGACILQFKASRKATGTASTQDLSLAVIVATVTEDGGS